MAKITQNRRVALFSLWSFNKSKAGKKNKMWKYLFNEKKNIFYDSQNMTKFAKIL